MTELIKIDDFTNVITGGTPSTLKKEYWQDGDIPWLNSGELNQDIVTFSSNFITPEGLKNSAARLMPPETVLIALTGATTGKIGYLTFEACANQSVTGILPSKKHFPKFLYYYLNSIRNRVLNDAYGGAQPHISQGYVKNIKIPLPPLETQKKIAAILDKADELRQNDKKILEKYDKLAQSMFLEMFGDPVKNEKDWELKSLKPVSNQITDGTHDTPMRISYGKKFITGKHIRPFKIDYENSDYVSEEDHKEIIKRCFPEYGDVLYTNIGVNLGTAAMNTVDYVFSMKNVALIKYKREVLSGRFLESLLNTKNMKSEIIRMASLGGAQQFLSLAQIRDLKIPIPPLVLQIQFGEIIDKIEIQKQITIQSIQKSEELFQSLLQRAFRGELM
jgi:type I restriction enzyme S subunit